MNKSNNDKATPLKLEEQTGELPYLGIEDISGELTLFEEKIVRPDYQKIKSDPMISLKDCIRILTGIKNLNLIADKETSLIPGNSYRNPKNGTWLLKYLLSEKSEDNPDSHNIKYREDWFRNINFIHKFLNRASLWIEAGFLDKYSFDDITDMNKGRWIYQITEYHYKCSFKILDFLNWVEKSGYSIPKELSINEKKDGIIQWLDQSIDSTVIDGKDHDSSDVFGKERQELGRLRAEKNKMDSTVKAAINVGRYIEKKSIEKKLIIKGEIQSLINKIDFDIPYTRIDLIWKSIPDNLKYGPGRPKKH